MSPLDASFLELEDADRNASLAIASVAVLEGPAPSYDQFVKAIEGRLALVPRYRQKVRRIPLDLGCPVWVDDPKFDITNHIRAAALPAPGGDEELCALIEWVMSERMQRARPLWEYWLIEGLSDGKWALLSKVHHCMVDGVSATDLYRVLLDATPEPMPAVADDWTPAGEPSTVRLTADALGQLALSPISGIRALRHAARRPRQLVRTSADMARGLVALSSAFVPAHSSSLSGHIGQQRRYRFVRAEFDDLHDVGRKFGVTVNDVALAVISGAFRTLLQSRGEEPGHHAIRSLVPVSVRAPGQEGIRENRVSLLLAYLPVDIADPTERLIAVHDELAGLKASKEAEAGESLTSIAVYEPFPFVSWPERLVFRLPQHNIVTVTTNVPGPRFPLYALGRRIKEIHPYVPIATTVRLGISIFSFCDHVSFGITGDRDTTADIDVFAYGIEDALAELVKAAHHDEPPAKATRRR